MQNYSHSDKASSSVLDADDFSHTEDKVITNTISVRIHNFIVLNSFKEYPSPLLIGLESKKINIFGLEISPPTVEIKYNHEQYADHEGDDDNDDDDDVNNKS